MRRIFILLALFCIVSAQDVTEAGNVTRFTLVGAEPSTRWDGLFGEIVLGTGANYTYAVIGNNVTRINMVAQQPNCTPYYGLTMHVIAVNATGITLPLSRGNLTVLDSFINYPLESGTLTFSEFASLSFSYGSFTSVPSMHTNANNISSPYFREFYLNDNAGNLVFVADIVDNRPDWNSTTSDYQIALPNNGTPVNYTIWVETNYTCGAPPPPSGHRTHDLYVDPPGIFEVPVGSAFTVDALVENLGDYTEDNITVSLACPGSFSCGSGTIAELLSGRTATVPLPITVDGPGEYVLTVCAGNAHDSYCQDFIVRVIPGCISDGGCPTGQYCDNQTACKQKKEPPEPCGRNEECATGLCSEGKCAYCSEDSHCCWNQGCGVGYCKPITCACGKIVDHACVSYQCCAHSDCGSCSVCADNSCVKQELSILVSGATMAEGETVLVQVLDNAGRQVSGAEVFTAGGSATTDAHGYATIKLPYDGLIYAKTACAQAGLMLTIARTGHFVIPEQVFVGEQATIRLVDRKGMPIVGATVHIDGLTKITDNDGRFTVVFDSPGQKLLSGSKPGYLIKDALAPVSGRPACGFPVFLGWFLFYPASIWQLWLFSLILALVNLWLVNRRSRRRLIFKLAYAAAPLLLALPGWWPLSICFMSNIVMLQFLAELLLALWRMICPFPSDKKERAEDRTSGSGKSRGRLPPSSSENKG